MDNIEISFSVPSDSEGYVTFECPFCQSEFKLLASEAQNDEQAYDELFCPYCGLIDKSNAFHSPEVVEHAQVLAQNYMIEQLNEAFGKMAKKVNKSKVMKMEIKPLKKGNIPALRAEDTTEEVFQCKICGLHEKVIYCAGASKAFCAYCGVDI